MKHRPLVAMSSAAILAVYAAGYVRTRSAADRFAAEATPRRAATVSAPHAQAVSAPPALPTTGPVVQIPPFDAPRRRAPETTPPAAASPAPPVVSEPASAAPPAPPAETQPLAAPQPEPATETAAVVQPPTPAVAETEYKDGTYLGWGYSRHGDIQASVVIDNGRIASATVARCLTRYSCSWIEHLPPQVTARQSPNVDYVSGATESSDAFYQAVVDALSKAK
jgi:uncharacterized protein with FMN-binding domain